MKLYEIGTIITGNTPSKNNDEYYISDDIMFVKPGDIEEKYITNLERAEGYISEKARNKVRILPKGTILVTCIGTIGKVGILENEATCNQQINAIIPNNMILSKYLAYLIKSKQKILQLKANAPVVPIINKTDFSKIEINICDREEQKKIVKKLDLTKKIIDIRKKQIEELRNFIKSQFVEMFGSVELNDKCFCEQEMSDIADITSSKRIYAHEYQKSGVPFYRSKEIIELGNKKKPSIELFISTKRYEEIKEKYGIPKTGDILITAVGTIGETWIVDTKKPFYYKDGNVLQIRLKKESSKVYFKYVLDILIDIFKRKNVSGSSYSALTIEKFKKMKIIIPPITLQNQFSEIVKQIDKQKFEIEKSLKETQELYESLMEKYFG